ncbi:hypothetical protein B0H21DRAFT_355876 [Amylocystis lapponica]|nr:hypothetical protein B0H21DRAFT_355876 [Amylocystis lapponica]
MCIPPTMLSASAPAGPSLLYNLCAICTAYAYTTRHLAMSPLSSVDPAEPQIEDARGTIARLVPFLTDRRSKTVHWTLSSVEIDLWSRFEPGSMTPAFFSLLLRDAATLLQPSSVTVLSSAAPNDHSQAYMESESHPNAHTIRVLSDLSALFDVPPSAASPSADHAQSRPESKVQQKASTATHKLTFYAAHVFRTPTPLLRALAAEVRVRAEVIEHEESETHTSKPADVHVPQTLNAKASDGNRADGTSRIEELT